MNLADLPTLRQFTLGVEQVYHLRDPKAYRLLCERLYADGFDFPQCLSGVDMEYGLRAVLNLRRLKDQAEVTVWFDVSYDEPRLPTVCDLWGGLEWHEREAYDLVGLHFEHHPDLRRILLEDHWTIHPLQRRYDTGGYLIPAWQPRPVPDWEALDQEEAEKQRSKVKGQGIKTGVRDQGSGVRKTDPRSPIPDLQNPVPDSDLTQIRALNANYAAKLQEQGITNVDMLAALPDDKLDALATAIGLKSPVAIKKWREGARELVSSAPTAEEQGSEVRDQGSEKPTPDTRPPTPDPQPPTADSDLTQIRALNATYAAKLQEQGITSLGALAQLSDAQAEQLASTIGLKSPEAVNKWREGARELAGDTSTTEMVEDKSNGDQGAKTGVRSQGSGARKADPRPPAPDPQHPDDLMRIKGIGPTYAKMLAEHDIRTFKQLAALNDTQIAKLEEAMNFKGRVEREKWREQAKALSGGSK